MKNTTEHHHVNEAIAALEALLQFRGTGWEPECRNDLYWHGRRALAQ